MNPSSVTDVYIYLCVPDLEPRVHNHARVIKYDADLPYLHVAERVLAATALLPMHLIKDTRQETPPGHQIVSRVAALTSQSGTSSEATGDVTFTAFAMTRTGFDPGRNQLAQWTQSVSTLSRSMTQESVTNAMTAVS